MLNSIVCFQEVANHRNSNSKMANNMKQKLHGIFKK